jgi:radical SAM protein with 4Fe4S-binding SPASM domain
MDELGPYLLNVSLYFQGEPMMHPQFFDFMEKSRNIYSVVSTNGHFLTPENSRKLALSSLNRIIVSLDGMDHGNYVKYRKTGDFSIVKKGICNLSDAIRLNGSSLKIEIQYLVNRFNEPGIPEMKRFARDVGAELKLKSMQILNEDKVEYWQPSQNRFRRYYYKDGKYRVKSSLPDRCLRLWLNPVITWDGKVVPCCFDKDARWVMGDMNNQSFSEIWHGEKYNSFRRMILKGRKNISMCTNCTSGLREARY